MIYEGRPLPLGTLGFRGSVRPIDNSYRVEDVDIQSGSLGPLTGELVFHGGSLSGRLDGANLPADNLVALARALGGREWDGWSPAGAVDLAARLEPAAAAPGSGLRPRSDKSGSPRPPAM